MQVVRHKGTLVLAEGSVPQPKPGPEEVLVRVRTAGVTPTELSWYPTTQTPEGEERRLAIPGHEFSGIVAAVGSSDSRFQPGNSVFGMNGWFADGATAEYCLANPDALALKPSSLTDEEAATVPIGALTAWQGLFEKVDLQPGERILIHGAAGSVGLFAVQLAVHHGAKVIATTSARNLALIAQLGASSVIDYKASRFEDYANEVDVIFDTIGGETLERSWRILGPKGRLVTVASDTETTTEQRVKNAFFIVKPDGARLTTIADLLAAGKLRAFVNATVPFEQAPLAYGRAIDHTRGYGKVVVAVSP